MTVRELRDFLFPHGWRRVRDWPRIRAALYRARDYVLPAPGGGNWLPFALRREPGEAVGLDDQVLIDVELPPGATQGPQIDRRELARLGVDFAPRFRAFITGRSVLWRPGVTRRPVPRSGLWGWSHDPADYPILTADDRDRLAFGDVDRARKEGRRKADAYWDDLPGVKIVDRRATLPDGREGWRIAPSEIAAKLTAGIRKAAVRLTIDQPNRGKRHGENRTVEPFLFPPTPTPTRGGRGGTGEVAFGLPTPDTEADA